MATITFKVPDDEARRIRARARQLGLTVSEYLRRVAAGPMPARTAPRRVRCQHTGAVIFEGTEALPPLTTESVRDLLSDYP